MDSMINELLLKASAMVNPIFITYASLIVMAVVPIYFGSQEALADSLVQLLYEHSC